MSSKHILLGIVVAILLIPFAETALAGIKCWTNDQGVRECGNTVPPEYSQQGHEELSKQGVVVKKMSAAKTAEELAAEREAKRAQEEREQLAKEQAAKDRVLLDTFTTEEDLILARDGKLRAIDSRIDHTVQITEKLNINLKDLEAQAADQERSGQPVSEELLNDISEVKRQIEEQTLFVEDRIQEKEELRAQFDVDLARYRELKAN